MTVVLPAPFGPEKAEDFAGIHLQIQTDERDFGGLPELTAGEFDAQFFSLRMTLTTTMVYKGCFVN